MLFSLIALVSFGQFEGTIVYGITLPDAGGENASLMASMMPSEATLQVGKTKSRIEMKMGMGIKNVTIADKKSKEVVTLMDIMGQKMAMTISADDIKKGGKEAPKFKLVTLDKGDQVEIAGYKCKHAIYEDENGSQFDVYYTEEFGSENYSASTDNPFKDLKGLMLKYTIAAKGMKMTMTAKSVVKEKVDDSRFVIPSDYKPVTQEQLMKMYGGGQ